MKWREKNHIILWSVVIIQAFLVSVGFQKVVFDGQHQLFMDSYDGMRNYFAYHEYIIQGKSDTPFLFEKMNYPFGDYIFYTDNTPLIAVPLKWFSENIYDLSTVDLQFFHWFFTVMMLLSSVFLYLTGKVFIKNKWLIVVFSIAMPWISPQIMRLGNGHFGLGLTVCIFAVLYGLVKLYQFYPTNQRKAIIVALGIVVTIILSSFLHLYFLIIDGVFVGYFCLFWAITQRNSKIDFLKIGGLGLGIPLVSLGVVYGTIRSIDTYYFQRSNAANGFYKKALNVKFDAYYQPYDFSTIPSFLPTPLELHYEQFAYLGAFAVYTFAIFFILLTIKKWRKSILTTYLFQTRTHLLIGLLLLSGLGCLWISFGIYAQFFGDHLRFDNWLNPFYWLADIAPQVTHFRSMGRFNWVFFIVFNLSLLFWLDQYAQRNKGWLKRILIVVLPILLIIDTVDMVRWHHNLGAQQPLNNSEELTNIDQLLKNININEYQAILPLPYYHSSCEDYNYTIDAVDDKWCTTTFQFSTFTDLPLMASKMGRTPLDQTHALFDIFLNYEIPTLITNKLSPKPILVLYKNNENAWVVPEQEPARTAFLNGKNFPEKLELQELTRYNQWILYEWNWQENIE